VEDTGDFAKYGVDFDIYFDDHETAQNWGHKTFKCYLADDKAKGKQKDKKKSNDVKVITRDVTVHNLTWQDYVNAGTLSKDEVSLLTDMMNGDYRISSGSSAGETVALMAQTKVGCRYSQDKRTGIPVYIADWFPAVVSFSIIKMEEKGKLSIMEVQKWRKEDKSLMFAR
jgi:hypothetical protein